jgi:hypothetical protein
MVSKHSAIGILFLFFTIFVAGCTSVSKKLVLEETPRSRAFKKLHVSSLSFTAPKPGTILFSYTDVTPPIYIGSTMLRGGVKRADVIYTLGNEIDGLLANGMAEVFVVKQEASSFVSGQFHILYSDFTTPEQRHSSADLDVAIRLTLDMQVIRGSSKIFEKSYSAQSTNRYWGGIVTFPSASFLNALFSDAFEKILVDITADKELENSITK